MNIATLSLGFIDLPKTTTLNIFAQGCVHQCEGCSNPQCQPFSSEFMYTLTDELFDAILTKYKPITKWICWLGGDSTCQPLRLARLSQIAKARGFNSCLYTGFKFASDEVQSVLKHIDVIIDGKWEGVPITSEDSNQSIYIRKDNTFHKVSNWEKLYEEIK